MSTEVITLNKETLDNILQMVNSVDQENKVVALSCLDGLDFNTNLVYLLFLKKEGNATGEDWKTHAPQTTKMLQALGVDMNGVITYRMIQDLLLKKQVSVEDFQYYLDRFARQMHNSIKNMGYDFIDSLEITIKLKEPHGEQSRTISESIKRLDA